MGENKMKKYRKRKRKLKLKLPKQKLRKICMCHVKLNSSKMENSIFIY